jgi:hypothetical protein
MYLGDEWKDVVHDLMKRSQLILMFAGNTPHFAWELQRVFQNDPFVPTILVLPFFQRYRQREVDLFVSMFEATTGLHLSKDLRKTRAAFFPHAAEIVEIHELNTSDERALNELNPFLGPIAQIMELGRPGWTDGYIEFARENRQSNRRWIFAGATALLLLTSSPFWVGHWTDQKAHETEIAEQFFADEIQGTNPCTDPKLSKLIPDSNECFKAILRSYVEGADICKDPSLAQVFPDSGTCGNAMQQAYLRRASIGNK